MAKFAAQALVSVRANKLVVGETYTMGLSKDAKTHSLVEFLGFFNGAGERVPNPSVIKSMPQDTVMKLTQFADGVAGKEITVVKDPAGFGAMFIDVAGTLKRVTFGADPALIASLKAKAKAEKDAAEAAKAAEKAEEAAPADAPAAEETAEAAA